MIPTLFASVNPCLSARLDRGYNLTEYPLGIYHKEMDTCIRASSILYSRLFEHSERIRVADRRSKTEISKNN